MGVYFWQDVPYRTFTISWEEKSDMSSGWTYSDDATGLTAGSSAFDTFFGYSGVRLNSSGTETAEITQTQSGGGGKLDITQLGTLTSGDNVMIKFPRRGIKMTKSGSVVTLSITNEENKAGYSYIPFTRGTTVKDNLYIGAYALSSGDVSLSGKTPLGMTSPINYYNNIITTYGGNGYSMIGIYQRWYICALYFMKYGNPDSRTVIGPGRVSGGSLATTGGTNSQINATYGTSSNTSQIKLFGIEDFRGNTMMHVAYAKWNASKYLLVNQTATLTDTSDIYNDSNYPVNLYGTAAGGWINTIYGTNDAMFLPTSQGGDGSTYYKERIWCNTSRAVCTGASYTQAGGCITLDYTNYGATYDENGTRLMKL